MLGIRRIAWTVIALLAIAATPANAQSGAGKIWPKSVRITGPNGEHYLAIPLRFYLEYGRGTAESKSHPTSKVDIERDRYTVGADFMTSWSSFWGVNLQFANIHDAGTQQPFVFSLDTEKDFVGGRFYVAHYILPRLLAGVSAEYHKADGRSIYNMADVNNESSEYYSFTPFLLHEHPVNDRLRFTAGVGVNFNRGDFSYDLNLPPTADTRETVLRVPLTMEYNMTPNFAVSLGAQWNRILSISTFDNMPEPDHSTVTLSAGARFLFDTGVSVYGSVEHDVLDDAYDSTRFNVGLSVPFSLMVSAGQSARPPRIVK